MFYFSDLVNTKFKEQQDAEPKKKVNLDLLSASITQSIIDKLKSGDYRITNSLVVGKHIWLNVTDLDSGISILNSKELNVLITDKLQNYFEDKIIACIGSIGDANYRLGTVIYYIEIFREE